MATTTTLGFSILSRYSGHGVTQARRDLAALRAQMATINGDLQRHTNLLGGIPQRWKMIGVAVAGVAPALVPLTAQLLATAGALTTLATAAGVSAGVWGLALKGAVSRINDTNLGLLGLGKNLAKQKAILANMTPGTTHYAKQLKAVQKAQDQYNHALKDADPATKKFANSMTGMNLAWEKFISATQGQTLGVASKVMDALAVAVGKLLPLVSAMTPLFNQAADAFRKWVDIKMDGWVRFFADTGPKAMAQFITIGKNLGAVFGMMLKAFAGDADKLGNSLAVASAKLKGWAEEGGFQRFLKYVSDNQGRVNGLLNAMGSAIANVVRILDGFSAGSIHVLTDAFRAIAALNPESVKAFANAFILLRSPMAWILLNCPPLRDLIINLLAAMNPQIVYAIVAAFVALRVAFMLMNTALLTTPLGWLIIGLVALGAAIVILATKTQFFQTIWHGLQVAWTATIEALKVAWFAFAGAMVTAWNATWNAVKVAGQAVWMAIQVAWSAFTGALATAWTTVSSALVTAWNTVWNALSTAAQAVWTALQVAWNAFTGALATAWTAVSTALVAAWNAVWTGLQVAAQAIWTALQVAWNAFITGIQTIWTTVSGALVAAWNAVWTGLQTAAQAIWTALQAAWQAFLTAVQTVWTTVSSALSTAWNAVWNAIKLAATTIWTALQLAWQVFLTAVQTIWTTVSTALKAVWTAVWAAIKLAAETVWNALKVAWQTFLTAVQTIWNTVSSALKDAWNAVWNWVKTTAQGIWDAIKGLWTNFTNGIQEIWTKTGNWLKDKWNEIWASLKATAQKLWHEIGEIIEKAINAVIGIINGLIKGFNKITSFLSIDVSVGTIDPVNFNFAEGGMVGLTPYMNGGVAEFSKGGAVNLKKGGTLSGYAPGRDTVPAMLSKGEGVLTPEAVRGLGGSGFVHSANRTFAGHRGAGHGPKLNKHTRSHDLLSSQGFSQGGMVQHFAVGGMVADALARAGVSLGMVSQGEYSNGSLSAGTHAGGGVVDISSTSGALVAALRAAGFAAWARTGPAWAGNEHIHAVLMNHPDLSGPARAQVAEYLAGGDGLGAGGGGGGGIDILGMVKEHIGKILKNVYSGASPLAGIGGALAQLFGIGSDEDDGGLFGTGIGPDIGPNVADAVGNVVESVTGIGGQMMSMLGQVVLSALDKGSIMEGLSDATGKFGAMGDIAGGFGKIAGGLGKKLLNEIMPDFLMSKKSESTFNPADFAGGFGGGTAQWAPMAAAALAKAGIDAGQLNAFLALMQAESGGNPGAANLWDSNAMAGNPTQGLMQMHPGTFAQFRDHTLPNNILDPMANMVASANYIKSVYGGKVPGSPYALGTPGATSGVHLVGEQGPELLNFRGGETVTPAGESASLMSGGSSDDMAERFRLLAERARLMASTVQTSWTQVTSAGMTAKSTLAPVFTDISTELGTTIPGSMTAMTTANTAAWTAMQAGTTASWTAMRDGTYAEAGDRMSVKMPQWGNEMNVAVTDAWAAMGEGTSAAWEGMKEATRGPTNWIIANSYNNGLARLWNEVAAVIFDGGGRSLPTVATLAKGGPVNGPGTATSDSVPAMLSSGEHVWTAAEVAKAGGHRAVAAMRSSIMGGKPVQGASGGPGFALGGWLSGAGATGGSIDVSVPELKRGFIMDAVGPLLDEIDATSRSSLGGSDFRKGGAVGDVLSPSSWMREYITKDDELNRGGEGAEWARAQVGKPYVLGSFGSTFDCSTYMSGIATMIRDGVAAPWFTTHPFHGGAQSPLPGWERNLDAPFRIGITSSGIGHTGGTINGENFEATPPAVRSGPGARGADHSIYQYQYGFAPSGGAGSGPGGGTAVDPADLTQGVVSFDRGGLLQPGLSLVYNGTKKPEPVGHNLEPKGSQVPNVSFHIDVHGNADAQQVVDGINAQVLPKLRQLLQKGTGSNG